MEQVGPVVVVVVGGEGVVVEVQEEVREEQVYGPQVLGKKTPQ